MSKQEFSGQLRRLLAQLPPAEASKSALRGEKDGSIF